MDANVEAGYTSELTFYITPTADTIVTFWANWGTSSYSVFGNEDNDLYITQGEEIKIVIDEMVGATEPPPEVVTSSEPVISETSTGEGTVDFTVLFCYDVK